MPPKAAAAAAGAKTNGKAPNGKPAKSDAPTTKSKPAAPVGTTASSEDAASEDATAVTGSAKPDKVAYDKEQEALKTEIDSLTKKLVRFASHFVIIALNGILSEYLLS